MIKDIREINFPDYATLEQATVTMNDMGDRSISTQVKIDGSVVPDFSYDWEVEFKGERYIHPVRTPQGTKDNVSMSAKIDMVFYHWAIYEMKRHYFVEMASTTAGTSIVDKYVASLGLNLGNFVTAFNLVLKHYFGDRIVVRLNPDWQYDTEAQLMSISYSYIWDVLQQMHDIYGVRWTLKTNANGICEILMGYPAEEVSHIFEYGFEGGLLSVQRQVQSTDIRNRLLGRGGEKNLPLRYFKDKDPNNPLFEADPDWIPELANIAFTELRGKTFRDYVKGWKAKRYGGIAMANPTEAYLAGYNADKFDPIEYVEDKESIAKYGVLIGALENNSEIYPSIQGAPGDVDKIVDAEQVTDDNVDSAVENDSVTTNLKSGYQTYRNAPANSTVTIETLTKRYFSVPEGKVGNLSMSLTATGKYSDFGDYEETYPILKADTVKVTIHDKTTGAEVKSSSLPVVNIPSGDYYYMISADVETNYDRDTMVTLNIESVYLYTSTPNKSEGWKQTFDIWVRNIWGSSRNSGETDEQYADRVWAPILGDRMGGEARVVFSSGWLSFSSDWEFPIVGYAYDDSKEGSYWRLTLAKSEAELEASGKYIPYEGYNASAGDRFFFIGIDMPYQYVLWAEEKLDDFKRDSLLKTAEINPTWVIKTDKVRLNEDRKGHRLIDSLSAGSQIRLASKQFISRAYETLYVQSITYTWGLDTILHPSVEIVVSDKVYAVKNPVAQIQSNIESIQRQVGSLSNIQQIIRQICDKLYLRKDGVSDVSKSPTKFLGKVTGENFRQGQIGGRDWGIYRDETGKSVAEFDQVIIRELLKITELEVDKVSHLGGTKIMSLAEMECTDIEETDSEYICYFDQKQGTKTNPFAVNDIVWCQDFSEGAILKYYKSVVTAVGDNYISISKTRFDGDGIPSEGDVLVQAGNTSVESRQSIIIIETRDNPSISLYRGVNSFDLPDPETRIQSGNNLFTGKVHMTAGSDGLDQLPEWIEVKEKAEEALEKAGSIGEGALAELEEYIDGVRDELQKQIDGAINSYFEDYEPSTSNFPAKDWTTEAEKDAHLNDTFTNLSDGRSWRWGKVAGSYTWVEIADTATSEALRLAGEAKSAVDGKIRMFVTEPYTPYSVGDLWSRGEEAPLMICVNDKETGAFDEADWGVADNSQAYVDEVIGNIKVGGKNLIRNSGFTGDFVTENLDNETNLKSSSELFSNPLAHWTATKATVQDCEESLSGKSCVLNGGSLFQTMKYNMVGGESYVLSFKARGESLLFSVGGSSRIINLSDEWGRYTEKFVSLNTSEDFLIRNATCEICEIQLEKGTIPSTWGPSVWDNQSELAKYQSMQYLESSMKDGSTDILGGLIMSNILLLGNPEANDNTAGVSGIHNDDNDVAFWGGGTYTQAIQTAMKYVEDPNYQPTDAEVANMAKAVITHGGRAILNDAILRGTIYAKNGEFNGKINVDAPSVDGRVLIDDNGLAYFGKHNDEEYMRVALGGTCQGASLATYAPNAQATFCTNTTMLAIGDEDTDALHAKGNVWLYDGVVYVDKLSFLSTLSGDHGKIEGTVDFEGEVAFNGKVKGLQETIVISDSNMHRIDSENGASILVNMTSGTAKIALGSTNDGNEVIIESKGASIQLSASARIYNHYNQAYISSNINNRGVIRLKYYESAGEWTMTWIARY